MSDSAALPASSRDAFFEAFRKDVEADAVRPLAEYLARFPGDDAGIAGEYRKAIGRGPPTGPIPPPADLDAGRIGPYRILSQIGRGAQGTVYLAEEVALGRNVALKVLDLSLTAHPEAIARFRREAAITSKLDAPGICPVYATGEDRGSFWIAMRYVEGDSLAKKISTAQAKQAASAMTSFVTLSEREDCEDVPAGSPATDSHSGPTTWTEIARILALFEEVARTLHVAHEAGVIHRDIKPGNLIVAKEGIPVILDFGLAQEMESAQKTLTLTGDMMGTPAYMSPEQLMAQRIRLDRRTDVYSLGVSLYECLTLTRPFEAPTREGLYQAILTKHAIDPRETNPSLPADVKVVLDTAIEKDRDRRYQTALDLAEELRRLRTHEPIRARPAGPILRLRRWARRRPAIAALVLALAVGLPVATGVGAWAATDRAYRLSGEHQSFLNHVEQELEIGFAELGQGRPEDAITAFDRALRLDGGRIEAVAGLLIANLRMSNPAAAHALLETHRDLMDHEPAFTALREAVFEHCSSDGFTARPADNSEQTATSPVSAFVLGEWFAHLGHFGHMRARHSATHFLEQASRTSDAVRPLYRLEHHLASSRARQLDSSLALVKARLSTPGWWTLEGEHYLIVSNSIGDARPRIATLLKNLEALHRLFLHVLPPRGTVRAPSVVRVVDTPQAWLKAGANESMTAFWNEATQELVVRSDAASPAIFHEAFHQYEFHAFRWLSTPGLSAQWTSGVTWFVEGFGEYFAGAEPRESGLLRAVRPDDLRIVRAMLRDGNDEPFSNLFGFSNNVLRNNPAALYAQSWSIIYFLRHGIPDDHPWRRILPVFHDRFLETGDARLAADAALDSIDLTALEMAWRDYIKTL